MQLYYLRFLVISSFISIAGACSTQQAGSHASNTNGTSVQVANPFSYLITGCASEKEVKLNEKAADEGPFLPEELTVTVKGDSILYSRIVTHLCCRKVKLSTEIKESSITITEYWYRHGCKCKCNSTINAIVDKLIKGNYNIRIIETGTDPFNDQPVQIKDTIWTGVVTII